MENQPPRRRVTVISEPNAKSLTASIHTQNPSIQQPINTAPQAQNPKEYKAPVNERGERIDRLNIEEIKKRFQKSVDQINDSIEEDEEYEAGVETSSTKTHSEIPYYKPKRVNFNIPNDAEFNYERIDLPSNGLLYPNEIFIRPLSVPDLIDLHPARKVDPVTKQFNQTLMLDVLSRTIKNMDIRDLHIGDFRFVFYWLKINSYTKTPLTVTYLSKYGNRNKAVVKKSDIKIQTLDDDSINDYLEQGFIAPRIRDGEEFQSYLQSKNLGDSEEDLKQKDQMEYAFSFMQFIEGDSIEEKIENFSKLTPDNLVDIIQFSKKLSKYGIIETVEVKDAQFNPEKALIKLKEDYLYLENFDTSTIENTDIYDTIILNKEAMKKEIDRIETGLSERKEVGPSKETVSFKLDLESFFPEYF
jgi:hypothetical protein